MISTLETELESETKDEKEYLDKAEECVDRFCTRFDVNLVRVGVTHEKGYCEPMYFFDNNLGGYTADALRDSLE